MAAPAAAYGSARGGRPTVLNVVWVGLIVIGVATAAATGRLDTGVTRAAFDAAKLGVENVIAMTGILIFWLGIARVAEAGILRPVFRHIFPSLDPRGPALRAILLNVAANVLGLGQAATPFGLKAMKELQACSDEEDPTVASDAMVTLLVLNTAGVTLIPATVIAYRAAAGSHDPAQIVPATICASFGSTVLALILDALLRRRRRT
jgi:spore maturation protein A